MHLRKSNRVQDLVTNPAILAAATHELNRMTPGLPPVQIPKESRSYEPWRDPTIPRIVGWSSTKPYTLPSEYRFQGDPTIN